MQSTIQTYQLQRTIAKNITNRNNTNISATGYNTTILVTWNNTNISVRGNKTTILVTGNNTKKTRYREQCNNTI